MHRCEHCGNTNKFVIDYHEQTFGTVTAQQNKNGDWECNWNTRRNEDGNLQYGNSVGEIECAKCGSKRVEEPTAE